MRFLGGAVLTMLLSLPSVAVGQTSTTFQVLTEELKPYSYREKREIKGVSVEIVREIMNKLGHPDTIKILPWSRAYNLTLNNPGYILFSTVRTPERENLFKWAGPLGADVVALFALKGSGIVISSLEDAKKVKSIGAYKDDVGEILLKKHGFANLHSVVDDRLNVKKLAAGRIDLWISNELIGHALAMDMGYQEKFEVVFKKENGFLFLAFSLQTPDEEVARWQKAMDDLKSSGRYAQILDKYHVPR